MDGSTAPVPAVGRLKAGDKKSSLKVIRGRSVSGERERERECVCVLCECVCERGAKVCVCTHIQNVSPKDTSTIHHCAPVHPLMCVYTPVYICVQRLKDNFFGGKRAEGASRDRYVRSCSLYTHTLPLLLPLSLSLSFSPSHTLPLTRSLIYTSWAHFFAFYSRSSCSLCCIEFGVCTEMMHNPTPTSSVPSTKPYSLAHIPTLTYTRTRTHTPVHVLCRV